MKTGEVRGVLGDELLHLWHLPREGPVRVLNGVTGIIFITVFGYSSAKVHENVGLGDFVQGWASEAFEALEQASKSENQLFLEEFFRNFTYAIEFIILRKSLI